MATADEIELVTVEGERIAGDLLVWRRYRRKTAGVYRPDPAQEATGMYERFLDINQQLYDQLRARPFIDVGTVVAIPIDRQVIAGAPIARTATVLYGTAP